MNTYRRFLIPAAVGAALLLAACGSSASNTSSSAAGGSAYAKPSAPASSASLTVGTTSNSTGTYLTGASGRALYLWVADPNGRSTCSGACAQAWPPLTASSLPKVSGSAKASDLQLISRPGGVKQVAYKNHPLYYFAGDSGAGMTNGQGSDQFGAKWWLVNPSGSQVSGSAKASSGGGYG